MKSEYLIIALLAFLGLFIFSGCDLLDAMQAQFEQQVCPACEMPDVGCWMDSEGGIDCNLPWWDGGD